VLADAVTNAIAVSNDPADPRVAVRGSELVRMTERGELEALDGDSMVDEMSRAASFFTWAEVDGERGRVYKQAPRAIGKVVLDVPG